MVSKASKNPYSQKLAEFPATIVSPEQAEMLGQSGADAWARFFQKRSERLGRKLVLEIGCSNAEYLSSIAKEHPDCAFVGLDWKFKVIYKGAKRIEREQLSNLILIRGLAQDLPKYFGASTLDEIWIFFPDPWAKKSQLKHRLVREAFLLEMHRLLKPGGRIHFKTDHPGYYQWVLSLLGLPEPELPKYDDETPEQWSRRTRQIGARRLEEADALPPRSEQVLERYDVKRVSVNYWREPEQPGDLFSGRHTLFERLFVKDQLPIYYAFLQKRL